MDVQGSASSRRPKAVACSLLAVCVSSFPCYLPREDEVRQGGQAGAEEGEKGGIAGEGGRASLRSGNLLQITRLEEFEECQRDISSGFCSPSSRSNPYSHSICDQLDEPTNRKNNSGDPSPRLDRLDRRATKDPFLDSEIPKQVDLPPRLFVRGRHQTSAFEPDYTNSTSPGFSP